MGTVIVAGGATGIGLASVRKFRERGDNVVLVDHREQAQAVADEPGKGACVFLQRDLGAPGVAKEVVETAVRQFGGLDTVLITAALMLSATLPDWTEEMWDRTTDLNLKMPFFMTQAAAPYLAASDNPSIIFTSSTGAIKGHAGMSAYQATKAALPGLARSLTAELGPRGIRINCILPGWIDTPFNDPFWTFQQDPQGRRKEIDAQIPLGRHGVPDEVSSLILLLSSEAGRYIAGTSIVIDGGYTAV
ncbi:MULTISPECIES: SDR family NAD(P)-dependent oxidoreductase [Komagataeibacter]|uniref:Oxidoreductase/short-chain dehydrogenase/reductase SDR n=2 Tax=Komagataeibacter TaxID=1434011 RepID=A0A0D6QB41_KOMXY|nr:MULTISPECIES: SDR family oxidoreductase [Komagataeibacter]MBL7233057.1 SDR family oxidoreductase [Komagataeibacter oboediens]MBT0675922.1 SDR family oxidoreductase [Komagataeibacter oboediens]MBT0677796.1 SDR family oxidoreductase [Komagataeibacter oboediens]MBV0888322.1 SDR family oxidoreductase [Komagataeibacter oboediens]MBV1823926.1 SDR family oxidoreductase [Komagataeibacter oboediens]